MTSALRSGLRALATLLVTLAITPAFADPRDDYAFNLQESSGYYTSNYVLTKLVTFKVGPKCWTRILDKSSDAVHAGSFITRDLADYAKSVTKDDWFAMESANNNDRENNKAGVEKAIDAFKSKLSITINVDGDDCDAKSSSLWIKYWGTIASALKSHPPNGGKAFITLDVLGKAREVTSTVSADGATFKFTVPRDIEPLAYDVKLTKPFKKRTAWNPITTDVDTVANDFVYEVKETTGGYYRPWVISKFVTFKLGKKCWTKMVGKDASAVHAASFYTQGIADFAKAVTGEDWSRIETQNSDTEANIKFVAKMMDDFKAKHHVTVSVAGDDCDTAHGALWLKYWGQVSSSLVNYPPKSGKSFVILNIVAKGKAVTASSKGDTITITAPLEVEPSSWSDKFEAAFKALSKTPK